MLRDTYKIAEIKEATRVLDLGANVGIFSLLMAKKFPRAEIIAVEPEEENIKTLRENIKLNSIDNIIVVEAAISDQKGEALLQINRKNQGAHSLYVTSKNKDI